MSNIKKPKTEIKMMREKEEKIKKLENVKGFLKLNEKNTQEK